MIIEEAKLKTEKGIGPGDLIIYSFNGRILFAEVEKIKENKILRINKELVDEDSIEILVCGSTMDSILSQVELVELFIQGDILSLNTKGFDRKAQLAHLLKNGSTEIIGVKLKEESK